MKNLVLCVLVSFLTLILLAGCGSAKDQETTAFSGEDIVVDMQAFLKRIEDAELFADTLERARESVLSAVMYLTTDGIETSAIHMGSGFTGEAFGAFKCVSADAAGLLTDELDEYVKAQKAMYADYAPDAIPRLNNAIIRRSGSYVAYVVAERHIDALKIVEEYFK